MGVEMNKKFLISWVAVFVVRQALFDGALVVVLGLVGAFLNKSAAAGES